MDMGFNFFGGSSFMEKLTNPAGYLHEQQYKKDQKAAQEATEAAKAQAAAAQAELKAQQEAQVRAAEQAALSSVQGDDSRTSTVQSGGGIDAANPLRRQRRRGADVTVGV